jgi:hypothetical protein
VPTRRHEGTKVPHDGLAEVPVRLDAGRHYRVARVQMVGMPPVLIPIMQSGSSASRLGGGCNLGRAARMNLGASNEALEVCKLCHNPFAAYFAVPVKRNNQSTLVLV